MIFSSADQVGQEKNFEVSFGFCEQAKKRSQATLLLLLLKTSANEPLKLFPLTSPLPPSPLPAPLSYSITSSPLGPPPQCEPGPALGSYLLKAASPQLCLLGGQNLGLQGQSGLSQTLFK